MSNQGSQEVETVDRFVDKILVFDDGWMPLPTWAKYLVRLGARMSVRAGSSGGRATFALVLPTRAFGAVFCAAGVILHRLSTSAISDPVEQFTILSTLPQGTMVTYRTKEGALFRGALARCDDSGIIVVPSSGSKIFVDKQFAHTIKPCGPPGAVLPKIASSTSTPTCGALMQALLGAETSSPQQVSRLDCAIVGSKACLRSETQGTMIGLEATDGLSVKADRFLEAPLQELLQVRQFTSKNSVFRSDVFSAGSRKSITWSDVPGVVIFDGAASFLKCSRFWSAVDRIILLDRADQRLQDAAAEVNREYSLRIINECDMEHLASRPPGTESLYYWSRKP